MNYKNIINFAIYCFVVVIFSVLLVFLMSEVFSAKSIYDFLKDQGSLIAGIIGFSGVFIVIWNQNKTTKHIIKANYLEKAYSTLIQINSCIDRMSRTSVEDDNSLQILDELYIDGLEKISSLIIISQQLNATSNILLSYHNKFIVLHSLLYIEVSMATTNADNLDNTIKTSINSLANIKSVAEGHEKTLIEKCTSYTGLDNSSQDDLHKWMQDILNATSYLLSDIRLDRKKIMSDLNKITLEI